MNKEELLKEIMKLPKVETINPISVMNVINVDDLMSAINRFDKVPDYNDLLKENQELKQANKEIERLNNVMNEIYTKALDTSITSLDLRDYIINNLGGDKNGN